MTGKPIDSMELDELRILRKQLNSRILKLERDKNSTKSGKTRLCKVHYSGGRGDEWQIQILEDDRNIDWKKPRYHGVIKTITKKEAVGLLQELISDLTRLNLQLTEMEGDKGSE